MRTTLFRRPLSVLAALAFTLVAGSMAGYGLSFAATAPAAQPAPAPAPAASPFGKLTPLAPVAPTTAAAPAPAAAGAAAPAAGAAAAAAPRIIVIDRNFIMQRSSAGKDMVTQTQNLSKQAETQFRTEEQALQNEAQALQQQLAILAADVRDQKEKEFVTKQQAFQTKVQQRQAEIQNGFNKAARQLEVALEPILQTIMRERGANMVLDRGAVIIATADIDVTPTAVQRLDKVLPRVKVELSATPPATAPGPIAAGSKP